MDRENVIKGLERCAGHDGIACLSCPYNKAECVDDLCADALALLKEQEEVVRCKDCKHWCKALIQCSKFTVNGVAHCTSPEWFCADGERRTDDG